MAEEQEAASENEETKPEESKPKSGRMKWIIVAILVLAGGGGAGAWFFYPSPETAEIAEEEIESQTEVFFGLENFLVNLADPTGGHYLRVGIDLGLEHEIEGSAEELELTTALVRDTVLLELSTWESDPLLTTEGKAHLKEALLRALRERLPELGVVEIYFNDFLVQR